MEQLIIFLLFVAGSIISGIIQKKKKAQDEAAQRGGPPTSSSSPQQPPLARWPRTAQEWQDQLRRMVEENAPPAPKNPPVLPQKSPPRPASIPPIKRSIVPRTVAPVLEKSEGDLTLKSPLRESTSAYQRASSLHSKVEERLRAIDQQTASHRPALAMRVRSRPASAFVRDLRRKPSALRDAFVASLIFSPPKAFSE